MDLKKHYTKYHDNNHQASLQKNEARLKSYRQEVEWLKSLGVLSDGMSIFDYGCSGGYLLDYISGQFSKCVLSGYDLSDDSQVILRQKGYFAEPKDLRDPVDLIIVRGVIEHVVDFKGLMAHLASKIRVGGCLFITATPNGSSAAAQLLRHNWVQHHYPSHIQHFSDFHIDYLLSRSSMLRLSAVDLYQDSPYFEESSALSIMGYVSTKEVSDLYSSSGQEDQALRVPFYGSMLTLLYKKV